MRKLMEKKKSERQMFSNEDSEVFTAVVWKEMSVALHLKWVVPYSPGVHNK